MGGTVELFRGEGKEGDEPGDSGFDPLKLKGRLTKAPQILQEPTSIFWIEYISYIMMYHILHIRVYDITYIYIYTYTCLYTYIYIHGYWDHVFRMDIGPSEAKRLAWLR